MARKSNETLELIPETDAISETTSQAPLYDGLRMTSRQEVKRLLAEAHSLKEMEARLKLVKARLAELIQENGLESIRHATLCCQIRYQAGRKTLDRGLLIDNGVTPDQIENSFRIGTPFQVIELSEMD